ncbi:chemotaxis protein CheW [Halobiforma lacisalsi AJ5]|uniref:Chemotaxis protein CheW n=2 Tax=Natronobacterium TaxID=2256 RepID=M0LR20_NATLA|nr:MULTISPECIES: chemotaxis protein CheW [Halobiforma]APW99680.1 chemotaxis protein CheW [Halobiforma lacisalsi AJ5]EMA35528.1 chemotaxis protein CheW [Halobiforma lacisalsi AJ5]SFC10448.1 purine-binding chemotaxis protein CheW [Halobiforma haloterrestris]
MTPPSDVDDPVPDDDRHPDANSSHGSNRDAGPLRVLTFGLADDRYCVRTDAIATVLGVSDPEPVMSAPEPWNAGTITVDGERVRIVDLARIFTGVGAGSSDRPQPAEPTLLVLGVTDGDGAYYGWLVDRVGRTRTIERDALEPPRVATSHVEGRFTLEDGGAILLDERAIHG